MRGLRRTFLEVLALRGARLASGFVIAAVLARTLGKSGVGEYSYILSWVEVIVIFVQFGLGTLAVRVAAEAKNSGELSLARGYLHFAGQRVALHAGLAWIALGGLLLLTGYRGEASSALQGVGWGLLMIPLLALHRVRQGTLQGLGQVTRGQITENLVRPYGFLALIGLLWWLGERGLSVGQALLAQLLAIAGAWLATGAWLRGPLGKVARRGVDAKRVSWMKSSRSFVFIAALFVINNRVDRIMLGALRGMDDAGGYFIAHRVASVGGRQPDRGQRRDLSANRQALQGRRKGPPRAPARPVLTGRDGRLRDRGHPPAPLR